MKITESRTGHFGRNLLALALLVAAAILLPAAAAGQEIGTLPFLPLVLTFASMIIIATAVIVVSVLGFWVLVFASIVTSVHAAGDFIFHIV